MKYSKEVLEKLILEDKLSYREIGKIFNVSDTYIKRVSKKLGIELPVRSVFPESFIPHNKKIKPFCNYCGLEIKGVGKKYCSIKCQGLRKGENLYKDFIENNEKYCNAEYRLSPIKPFILHEQENKCSICGIPSEWNGHKLTLVLDHIDGNASNNKRENLRCVCPNCDSQLDTYKSKNKNSARKSRYLLNYKNITRER